MIVRWLEFVKTHLLLSQVEEGVVPLIFCAEFMENGSLSKYLETNQLSDSVRQKIILGIARGMYHLHEERIIHRGY